MLDSDDLGKLKSNVAALDVVHYFVGSRSLIAPYAGAGVAGVWSALGPEGPALITPGGSQQFHFGINANVGVQVRIIPQLFGRAEWNTRRMLEGLLRSLGFTRVEIRFADV